MRKLSACGVKKISRWWLNPRHLNNTIFIWTLFICVWPEQEIVGYFIWLVYTLHEYHNSEVAILYLLRQYQLSWWPRGYYIVLRRSMSRVRFPYQTMFLLFILCFIRVVVYCIGHNTFICQCLSEMFYFFCNAYVFYVFYPILRSWSILMVSVYKKHSKYYVYTHVDLNVC